ncbi:ChaN family lipoprotein [Sedimenticola hydrogenitrophicus]|uniref:ChaN family lipoprotein n=1 Tax=Sedimenticola hydrogenitrophicus TaxID=2967975 RepID=UPI0023AF62F0|nr:ChaN family lipoprotein [Sedimenticola hydrogenitrophicus]
MTHRDASGHANPSDRQATEAAETRPVVAAVLDLQQIHGMEVLTPVLTTRRVVYVGETHDEYAHHKAQLAVIEALHATGADLAIGMEMFQQPYQPYLDDYIAGKITEAEMLRKTEWYERWVYDYRYYQPILKFAREKGIPVIALNISREITGRVSREGMESLSEQERDQIPADIDYSDQAYTERLKKIFAQHGEETSRSFERFLQVQLLWDEGMAERAASFLEEHPRKQLVILAGSGHLMHSSGIPNRVKRRQQVTSAIVLPGGGLNIEPGIADFVVFPQAAKLPPAAVIGVFMERSEQGVLVSEVVKASAAERGGVKPDDIILALDGTRVASPTDLRIELLGKNPGDGVRLTLLRRRLLFEDQRLDVDLILGQ